MGKFVGKLVGTFLVCTACTHPSRLPTALRGRANPRQPPSPEPQRPTADSLQPHHHALHAPPPPRAENPRSQRHWQKTASRRTREPLTANGAPITRDLQPVPKFFIRIEHLRSSASAKRRSGASLPLVALLRTFSVFRTSVRGDFYMAPARGQSRRAHPADDTPIAIS